MSPQATLTRISIFPVKSLDGMDVDEAYVLPCGAIDGDRRWRLVDMDGRVVNAKRTPRFHAIRSEFDLAHRLITLSRDDLSNPENPETFSLSPGSDGPCEWLSDTLGVHVLLEERRDGGFPDDREAPGPTVIATESLEQVSRWFGVSIHETRRRFRMNLEITGCGPFWEDALASPSRSDLPSLLDLPSTMTVDPYADLPPLEPRVFSIGNLRFQAVHACRRCAVPSRDSYHGKEKELFREVFEARRSKELRRDVDAGKWSDYYRLGINTHRMGDELDGETLSCGSFLVVEEP